MPTLFQYRQDPQWDGFPPNRNRSGWFALGLPQFAKSASTGAMVYLCHWCAKTQCWGTDHDRRPPAWAVQQKLTYLGQVSGAENRINVIELR